MRKRGSGKTTGQRREVVTPSGRKLRRSTKGKSVSKGLIRSDGRSKGSLSSKTSSSKSERLSQEIQSQANELARKNKELRQAHLKAEEESQKYRYLYETIPVASYTLDAQGTVLDLNEAGAMLLRSSRHHLVDRRFHVFIYESDRSLFRGFMRKVLKGAGHELCAVRLADDQTLSLVLVGVRRNNHERKRAVVQLAVMDVTGFIRVQGVLRDSNEALEATVNERTEQLTDALGRLNQEIEERRCAEDRLSLLNDSLEQRVNERTIALAEANERWEWVVRATHDGVWDWDLVRNKAYFSPRWKEMHGIQDGDLSESSEEWSSRIHPEDQQKVGDKLEAYLAGIVPEFWEEYRIQRKDGIYIWVLDRGVAVFDEEGRAIRMVGAETDITWRKESEEALRRSEQEFRTLADNVPALFSYIGLDFRYRFVNKRYEELFGRHDKTMVGMTVFDLLGSDGYAVVEPYLRKALEGESVAFEYELKVPGDGIRYLSVQYVPDRGKQGEVRGLFALLADVTALKLSEAALRGREAELRALNAKLVQVQEEERRRIARDLHDDVTQRLAALTLELHGMKRYAVEAGCDPSIVSKVKGLGESVERLTTDVQQLAHHLHPSILEHAGLEAAAREHADEFSARTGLLTEVLVRDLPKEVPLDQATCLYRVLQESLQNVRKHANASNVLVRLLGTNHGVGICVHDDGQGLESKTAGNRKGLGLTSMAERVWSLKGTFRVRTRPDDGTEIHAWVPLEDVKYKT